VKKEKISVVINTFNEENNIRNCLETVKWADEIVVVDMYSEDKTVEIVKDYTDKIFFFRKTRYVEPARQFALEKATNEWVLIVDADELVPKELRYEIRNIVLSDLADVVYIPRNNFFFGELLIATGWGALQDMQPRLFKRNYVKFSSAIHMGFKINPEARIYKITDPYKGFVHFNYIDVEHFIEKMNRYTTIEAKNMFEGVKPNLSFLKLLLKLLAEFTKRLFYKKGYLDGINGFGLSILMVAYHMSSFLKYSLMKKYGTTNPREKILIKYQEIAQQIIEEYRHDDKEP